MKQEINKNKLKFIKTSNAELFNKVEETYEDWHCIIDLIKLKEFIVNVEKEGFDKLFLEFDVGNSYGDLNISFTTKGYSETIETDEENKIRIQKHYDAVNQELANQKSLQAKKDYATYKRLKNKFENE